MKKILMLSLILSSPAFAGDGYGITEYHKATTRQRYAQDLAICRAEAVTYSSGRVCWGIIGCIVASGLEESDRDTLLRGCLAERGWGVAE